MNARRVEWLAKLCFSLSLAAMLAFVGITIVGVQAVLAGAWGLAENLGVPVTLSGAFMVGAFLLGFTLHGLVVMTGREAASPRGCSEKGPAPVHASGQGRARDP